MELSNPLLSYIPGIAHRLGRIVLQKAYYFVIRCNERIEMPFFRENV